MAQDVAAWCKKKIPVAKDVEAWCLENGADPVMRIAICGHIGDYNLPGWEVFPWCRGSYTMGSSKTTNAECVWFSPHCLKVAKSIITEDPDDPDEDDDSEA